VATKAELHTETGERIKLQFNPAELTISRSNSWKAPEAKGKNAPELRFQSGQSDTLTLSVTLDTTDTGTDVSVRTNALLDLMKVDKKLPGSDRKNNSGRPPWVQLHWGKLSSFKAVIERMQVKFTYFASDGTPLRAKADLTLKQYRDGEDWPRQNPTSHTPTLHTVHVVVRGETLDRIAAIHYADATRWRLIAEANDVVDPLSIAPGTRLTIPELPVRRRG
jgi:nucleoid-associated protein YgaU